MSHNSRSFIHGDTSREDPRTSRNAWRKFYNPDGSPTSQMDALHSPFASSSSPAPYARNWWGVAPPESWQPPPVGDDSRRFNFAASSSRSVLPPPRVYDPPRSGTSSSEFPERFSWRIPRDEDWRERSVTPFNDRPLGNDNRSPRPALSSPRNGDWIRDSHSVRRWSGPRRNESPSSRSVDRPILEPSQAWKDRERQMSVEHGATSASTGSGAQDFYARRYRQPLPPSQLPPPPARGRYNDRFAPPPFSRRSVPPRRPQPRVSARISARPMRDMSPSSSESSVRSYSRSSRSPQINAYRRSRSIEPGEYSEPSRSGRSPDASKKFTHRRSPPSRDSYSPSRRRSPSPAWSSRSSIRSSVHSTPRLVPAELEPMPSRKGSPVLEVAQSRTTSVPPDPQAEEAEFELPGMRFLKDGALKSGLDVEMDGNYFVPEIPPINKTEPVENSASTVEASVVMPHVLSLEVLEPQKAPEHSPRDEAKSTTFSPHSVPPFPANNSLANLQAWPSDSLSHRQSNEPPPAGHSDLILNKQNVTVEAIQRDEAHTIPLEATERALPPSESSPLSDPVPLSPPPVVSGFQDDVDEPLSMDVDDDSVSSSASSSGTADDVAASLRVFVRAREGKDLQMRNERYAPILHANHSLLDFPSTRISTSDEELVQEVLANSLPARLEMHKIISQVLLKNFAKRAGEVTERTRRLRMEYKAYHDEWVANCRKLDKNMASSASQGVEGLPAPSGRATRRSAPFGDMVRSDLEMEQIIASLGNEDMTDPNVLAIRNTAKIPDLINTDPSAMHVSFDDDNGMVDDPRKFYDPYDALGLWTDEEEQVFIQKYGLYPKQFSTIASFLPSKTPSQCVMFYYLHKKDLIDFRNAISIYGPKRKRRGGRKAGKGKGNALLADIVKPPRDGVSHKHSERFAHSNSSFGDGSLLKRPPGLQYESEDAINASRGRISAIQLEDGVGSDTDSVHPKRPRSFAPPATGSEDEDARETIGQRAKGRAYVANVQLLYGRRNKERTNQQDGAPEQTKRLPRRVRRHSTGSEDDEGEPVNNLHERQAPDHNSVSSISLDPRRLKEQVKPQEAPRRQDVTFESSEKRDQMQKGKEKEKRPPGRPPKKIKERPKSLEKSRTKPGVSYVWNKGEEAKYLQLLARHGKDFEKIAAEMPAKTALQCRNYFKSHAKELDLERIARESIRSESLDTEVELNAHPPSPSKEKSASTEAGSSQSTLLPSNDSDRHFQPMGIFVMKME